MAWVFRKACTWHSCAYTMQRITYCIIFKQHHDQLTAVLHFLIRSHCLRTAALGLHDRSNLQANIQTHLMQPLPTSVNNATCISFHLFDSHAHKHFMPLCRGSWPSDVIHLQDRELRQGLDSSPFTGQEKNDPIHEPDTCTTMLEYTSMYINMKTDSSLRSSSTPKRKVLSSSAMVSTIYCA